MSETIEETSKEQDDEQVKDVAAEAAAAAAAATVAEDNGTSTHQYLSYAMAHGTILLSHLFVPLSSDAFPQKPAP